MTQKPLGILEPVDIRLQWPDEAQNFTPWLASASGLALLAEIVDLDLELVGQEQKVGPFRADILARLAGEDEDRYVVIENQYGTSNHDHLGKIITYAAGLKAVTIVWIAESFTEEHRQALDWLNQNASEHLGFFGLEIQLWHIENSPAAPQFRIVSSPNEWAKAIKLEEAEPSDTKLTQLRFWKALCEYAATKKSTLYSRKPRPQHWYTIKLGRGGFHMSLLINSMQHRVGCQVVIHGAAGKLPFDLLNSQKTEIENVLGLTLEWKRLDAQKASHIAIYRSGVDLSNPNQWEEAKQWLYATASKFNLVFSPRIAGLELPVEDEGDVEA